VIIEGSGLMTLRGEEFPVRAGTGVHIPSYAEHGIRNTGSDELRIVYSFAADSMGDVNYQFSAGEPPAE
jgi:oxalate decarboxylase/phosphoglucose isomerase-like protein (cupin superfamily)